LFTIHPFPKIVILQICNPLFNFEQANRREGSIMICGWASV
jgi:hypothetical protein